MCLATKETTAGQGFQAPQAFPASEASADYTVCQAPKAFLDPQVRTSTETLASPVLLGTGATLERPTSAQDPSGPQDRKGSEEIQVDEAQLGVQDFKASQASPPLPTCLGYLVTKGHQGYLAWKVIVGPRDHLGLRLFLEAKEMRGTQELQEPPGLKDGAGTLGPRAGLACSVSPEKKGPEVSPDSWATQEPPGVWATEAPRDPRETEDSQVPLALWDPPGSQESPRRLPSSQGQWDHREGEALRGCRERWDHRDRRGIQVSVELQERQGPRAEVVCLLFPDSEETRGLWDTRGQWARKGSRAAQGPPGCQACPAAASASATSW